MTEPAPRRSARTDWAIAGLRALGMLFVSFLLFAFVPNWLVGYLALRVTTTGRDFILVGWFGFALAIGCIAFVSLQPRGDR